MAILSYRSNESVERVEQYLSHVLWSSLGSVYLSFHEKFEALLPHLRYEELRSYCGYDDNVMELVPTDISKADNALMEDYARKLICLAKIKGNARRRNTSIGEFTVIARNSITFMDSAKNSIIINIVIRSAVNVKISTNISLILQMNSEVVL